jgi:Protein of unknown function (DUF3176)
MQSANGPSLQQGISLDLDHDTNNAQEWTPLNAPPAEQSRAAHIEPPGDNDEIQSAPSSPHGQNNAPGSPRSQSDLPIPQSQLNPSATNHAAPSQPALTAHSKLPAQRTLSAAPRKSHLSSRLDQTWMQELAGIAISAIALLAIVIILLSRNNKIVPTSFSLNAAISALGTIAGLGISHTVCSSLSQLKWVWMTSRARRFHDFSLFDKGTRDELGAFELLIRGKFNFG